LRKGQQIGCRNPSAMQKGLRQCFSIVILLGAQVTATTDAAGTEQQTMRNKQYK